MGVGWGVGASYFRRWGSCDRAAPFARLGKASLQANLRNGFALVCLMSFNWFFCVFKP